LQDKRVSSLSTFPLILPDLAWYVMLSAL
jgi:hypothetical protein